ncbi:MAG: diacylglycerol kinase family protein, partial [Gemmatimonadaceae bacterium]
MIPAFINDAAGTAEAAKRALKQGGGFDIHAIKPDALENAVRDAASHGAQRIVVAGGDGTIGTAARALCGTQIALAVVPGGTLNHFARDHGIPTDADEAAAVAAGGVDASADVAFVGEHLFLNTSSVGAYVVYVRLRDRMEKYVGYRLASLIAAVRLFLSMRPVALELEVDGKQRQYSTPVVFIGVGERETRAPTLGSRVEGGRHCLHVIVVRERRAARLLVVALDAAIGGLKKLARTPEVDSFMVDSCSIQMQGR